MLSLSNILIRKLATRATLSVEVECCLIDCRCFNVFLKHLMHGVHGEFMAVSEGLIELSAFSSSPITSLVRGNGILSKAAGECV